MFIIIGTAVSSASAPIPVLQPLPPSSVEFTVRPVARLSETSVDTFLSLPPLKMKLVGSNVTSKFTKPEPASLPVIVTDLSPGAADAILSGLTLSAFIAITPVLFDGYVIKDTILLLCA